MEPAPDADGPAPALPRLEDVEKEVEELLAGLQDLGSTTLREFRQTLCERLGLPANGLETMRDAVLDIVQRCLGAKAEQDGAAGEHAELGEELPTFRSWVYLATVANVRPETLAADQTLQDVAALSRQDVATCFRDAFDNPLQNGKGGRPCARNGPVVRRLVVVRESHSSGLPHFHVALQLRSQRCFLPAKKTLRARHKLAVHFSCSHTQFWSALRYCVVPTLQKTEVDPAPFSWSSSNEEMDLYELAQRPFTAAGWKRRREAADMAAAAGGKKQRFTKLDLTAIILAKEIRSKNSLLEYAQTLGSEAMQQFVSNRQKHLSEYLDEAWEWKNACAEAARDRQTGWELICQNAAKECPFGEHCRYAEAAQRIFAANAPELDQNHLAASLRDVVLTGPSKTTRVPLLVGSTNTGKTTLVLPFDGVFGSQRVFHKPALDSKFALRNLLRQKRFIFWDDYRPVEYAQGTVQVSTFLSLFTGQPFEVQVSQSFSDGNIDFQWRHGCVMTAKSEGLWQPFGVVSQEDVRHMQSRVLMFPVNSKVPCLKDIEPCPVCLCKWITRGAAAQDAAAVLARPVLPMQNIDPTPTGNLLAGMTSLNAMAKLPEEAVQLISAELVALGACSVAEVLVEDWRNLRSFAGLRQFEQRRLLAAVSSHSSC